jgi:hypothetical protein
MVAKLPAKIASDPAAPPKNKVGRKHKLLPDEKTLKLIRTMAGFQATTREAAAHLNVSHKTFIEFKKDQYVAAAWEQGKNNGLLSLRSKQFKLADRSAAMAIFLGKNYLNQKDIVDHQGQFDVSVTDERMTRAQVMQWLADRGLPTTVYGILDDGNIIDVKPEELPAEEPKQLEHAADDDARDT